MHIDDMSPMSDAIHHCSSQYWIPEDLAPPVERKVRCDYGRLLACSQREVCKKQLSTFLVKRDVPELIAYHQIIFLKAVFEGP